MLPADCLGWLIINVKFVQNSQCKFLTCRTFVAKGSCIWICSSLGQALSLSLCVFWSLAQQPTFAHTCNQANVFVMTCYDFSQIQLCTECNVICTETRSVPYHWLIISSPADCGLMHCKKHTIYYAWDILVVIWCFSYYRYSMACQQNPQGGRNVSTMSTLSWDSLLVGCLSMNILMNHRKLR